MNLDDLIPPAVTNAVARLGLHKIAGAMLGEPELTIKEATYVLGAKAYLRRKEARSIVDGIAAYGSLTNVKVADNTALLALLRRAALPAIAGAGIAAVPQFIANQTPRYDPMTGSRLPPQSVIPSMGIGALLGGIAGLGRGVQMMHPEASEHLSSALRMQR